MTDVLDALKALEQGSQSICPAIRVAGQLDEEAGAYVLKLLKNDSISIRSIYLILRGQGLSIARESLTDHRKGDCRCDN